VNEYSLRYSKAIGDFYMPAPEQIRFQSKDNRQGRSTDDVPPELQLRVLEILKSSADQAWAGYEEMADNDIARELARIHLPVSTYTEWYWKIDLSNLLHFLRLRMDAHAQYEIRVFAEAIAKVVQAVVPIAWEAFNDYILNARQFSAQEMLLIADVLKKLPEPVDWKQVALDAGMNAFEAGEFGEKMNLNSHRTTENSEKNT
jgi:thymidylate synthase (FAD)